MLTIEIKVKTRENLDFCRFQDIYVFMYLSSLICYCDVFFFSRTTFQVTSNWNWWIKLHMWPSICLKRHFKPNLTFIKPSKLYFLGQNGPCLTEMFYFTLYLTQSLCQQDRINSGLQAHRLSSYLYMWRSMVKVMITIFSQRSGGLSQGHDPQKCPRTAPCIFSHLKTLWFYNLNYLYFFFTFLCPTLQVTVKMYKRGSQSWLGKSLNATATIPSNTFVIFRISGEETDAKIPANTIHSITLSMWQCVSVNKEDKMARRGRGSILNYK